jgi:hypothetical protein
MPPEPAPAYQMDFFERCFVVLTVVGSLGVIAVVIWVKVALSNDGASTGAAALHAAIGIDRVFTTVRSRTHQRPS